jgi:hypothetical protein
LSTETFSADWLSLRAPHDAAATERGDAAALAGGFGAALRQRQERGVLRLLDLGGGAGANVCRLAPRIAGSQHWIVVDNDAALLAGVAASVSAWARRIGGRVQATGDGIAVTTPQRIVTVTTRIADLCEGPDHLPLEGMDGVTGAALLDLVSDAWLEALAAALAVHRLPALFTLNVDGLLAWEPAAPDDGAIAAAFARDLARDKGFGEALGARAAACAAVTFAARGFSVETARSDWKVGPVDVAMHRALQSFIVPAALRQPPADRAGEAWRRAVDDWTAGKTAHIATGTLALIVGHTDVLALM